jgi:hypothetical protein
MLCQPSREFMIEKSPIMRMKSVMKLPSNYTALEKCEDEEHEFCLNLVDEDVNRKFFNSEFSIFQ